MTEILVALWLIPCAIQDLRRHEISNWLTIPFFLAGAIYGLWKAIAHLDFFFFAVLWIVYFGYKASWIGPADAKIIAGLAAFSPLALLLGFLAMGAWFGLERLRGNAEEKLPGAVGFAAGAATAAVLNLTVGWNWGII